MIFKFWKAGRVHFSYLKNIEFIGFLLLLMHCNIGVRKKLDFFIGKVDIYLNSKTSVSE